MKKSFSKNFCLIIEYIGKNYVGFQRQKNGISIQQTLENALQKSLGEEVCVIPSGRTDAGVHAIAQVVNFFSGTAIPAERLAVVINSHLPEDIRVKQSFAVSSSFHAQKSAVKKTYLYKIFTGENFSVFHHDFFLFSPRKYDLSLLNAAAKMLVGTHDFASFVASAHTAKSTVRTVFSAGFTQEGDCLFFEITGNGFLYNMVRIVVGTLLDVGCGKTTLAQFQEIFLSKSRPRAGKTLPPQGLYLKKVYYD